MEKNQTTMLAVGLGIVLAFVIGFMGYNLGMQNGARSMHMGMMNMEKEDVVKKPEQVMAMDHSKMTMEQMTEGLKGLRGDAFDKAFIEMMIVHHQGAVDMAKEIPANAKHAELKKMGEEIISAQTKEIEMMKGWLKNWGYEEDEKSMMMDSSDMMPGMKH